MPDGTKTTAYVASRSLTGAGMLSMDEVRVTILPNRETREVRATDVGHLLRELGLPQEAFIVIRDDRILTRDVRLGSEDAVEIWPVISGG